MASNFIKSIIYVNNIPWTVSRHKLALYFSQFGYVSETFVAFDRWSGFHKGYGHVILMNSSKELLKHKHFLEGKNLVISIKNHEGNDNGYNNNNNNSIN